ncbi:prepilin-type N-terminal cleavage/methylation domain-containing protein [Armatimonas sp.]|uniref:prepilin-type N-terminal cleavage/methylation domain-containing protein n=1 Tax=Armatimonas sp. TaxID=1872638 RepID=UPI0037529E5E
MKRVFTLIELLVVIAIIAILAAILFPPDRLSFEYETVILTFVWTVFGLRD